MSATLDDKRTATKFRVLAEIAEKQPAVSQGEIAREVGLTSQAVSEYTRDLQEEGYLEKEARSRYHVTKEGVDWLFQTAKSLRRFAEYITDDVLESVQEDAAIATEAIEDGDLVTLSVREGLLHATPGGAGPATGQATTDAEPGTDVSVTGFEGVIDLEPGEVTVYQVPAARHGGSRGVDPEALADAVADADLVLAEGVEAVVALERADTEPAVEFAAGEVAAEAATRGRDVLVVVARGQVGRVTDALRDADVDYVVEGA